ncbi:hypothetical protein DEO72_LG8g1558 [Vigna unguiculata]|nr:hypothetical protein DEO72_LG8g1558 [Vigna unguiculata]
MIMPNLPAVSLKLTGLAQAREALSLRQNPSRLGESAKGEQWILRGLAQARPLLAQKERTSPRRQFEWQILGEHMIISLRRV